MDQHKAVNETAQETVDTIDYVWQWLIGIWEAMPIGLQAFALTVFAVSLLMEWVKKAWLSGKPKRERIQLLWMASLPLGAILAAIGWNMTGKAIESVYWVVIGLTSGTTAMGLHYFTMKIALPFAQKIYGRMLLAIRGY